MAQPPPDALPVDGLAAFHGHTTPRRGGGVDMWFPDVATARRALPIIRNEAAQQGGDRNDPDPGRRAAVRHWERIERATTQWIDTELVRAKEAKKAAKVAAMVAIDHPRAFYHRDEIKALGGVWNATDRVWRVPTSAEAIVRDILSRSDAEAAKENREREARNATRAAAAAEARRAVESARREADVALLRSLVPLHGNTYPVREAIRAAGGRYVDGVWLVPPAEKDRLSAMLPQAPTSLLLPEDPGSTWNGRRVLRSVRRRITEDDPSIFGSHLLGHEGRMGFYVEVEPSPG